jgi:uncharacterized protein (DUF488 family)
MLFTIGHSTRELGEFIALLHDNGITHLYDVRRFPASRRYPHFNGAALEHELVAAGIGYTHVEAMGGRRATSNDSRNSAWRNASFRAYADYMASSEFKAALNDVRTHAARNNVVVMCAEAVPWRCHRNLIADAAVARGDEVRHITGPGEPAPHTLSAHARVQGGELLYPGEKDAQDELF